ncbi:MAG: hypothetical protein QOE97_1255 [Pseudonocardiales bacterium]|jgi:hypothetical protein|nr:hypothetical protein [Pseudonocardiales bacterium]
MAPSHRRPGVDELAQGAVDAVDEQLLAGIAALFETLDPVPAGLVERVQFGITLEALHAEIAQLQRGDQLAGARAEELTDARTITFTSSTLATMITVTPTGGDTVRIDGWIAPGAGVLVELRIVGSSRHAVADDDGRFVIDAVPRGLAQLVLRPAPGNDALPVVTPSVDL